MTNVQKHTPGSFCWIELATTDHAAAKSFYTALFGWSFVDTPISDTDTYTTFRQEGREAAAAYTLRPEQRALSVPPNWMIYVTVDRADTAAARARQAGGTVLADAFDVSDLGRMAILHDPTGAVFAVWQAKSHPGLGITGVDGTLSWADLSTPDPKQAGAFYAELFGWQMVTDEEDPEHDYIHIKNGEHFIGGIPPARDRSPHTPPHWLIYFHTSNCDATAAKAKELGANFYLPPTTMEKVGRMAVLGDPQGAVFALFQPVPQSQK